MRALERMCAVKEAAEEFEEHPRLVRQLCKCLGCVGEEEGEEEDDVGDDGGYYNNNNNSSISSLKALPSDRAPLRSPALSILTLLATHSLPSLYLTIPYSCVIARADPVQRPSCLLLLYGALSGSGRRSGARIKKARIEVEKKSVMMFGLFVEMMRDERVTEQALKDVLVGCKVSERFAGLAAKSAHVFIMQCDSYPYLALNVLAKAAIACLF